MDIEGSDIEGSDIEGSDIEGSDIEGSDIEGSDIGSWTYLFGYLLKPFHNLSVLIASGAIESGREYSHNLNDIICKILFKG